MEEEKPETIYFELVDRRNFLNLYERRNVNGNKKVLKLLAQVPFNEEGGFELSLRRAFEELPEELRERVSRATCYFREMSTDYHVDRTLTISPRWYEDCGKLLGLGE